MEKRSDRSWQIEIPEHVGIYNRVKPLLQTRYNDLHTRIAYYFALTLLTVREDCDPKVVIPAILMHDIGWSKIPEHRLKDAFGPTIKNKENHRLHETEGARMAGEVLHDLQYPEDRIREIQKIISGHDTRLKPFNSNDETVKDADKLWRYTREAFTIDHQRFEKTKHEHLSWLVECITIWFPSRTSRALALSEALKRNMEHGLGLDWQKIYVP